MKRSLLLAAFGIATLTASADMPKDPAVYSPVSGYQLTNNWIRSVKTDNMPTFLAGADFRGMAATDTEMYFCKRSGSNFSIVVVDGATGLVSREVVVDKAPFSLGLNGENVETFLLALNDIQIDAAGNVLVCNLCTDISGSGFRVDKINMETGAVTNVLNEKMEKVEGVPVLRVDAFNIYGSMDGDGYVLAPVAGDGIGQGDIVLKWEIKGGVAQEMEYIFLNAFVPSSAVAAGTAPRVRPVNNNLFYHDGFNTFASLYDMDGNMVDGLTDVETQVALAPMNPGHNGVTEFSMNGDDFMVFAATNTALAPQSSFLITRMAAGMAMTGMEKMYRLPAEGMGNATNAVRTAIPQVFVHGDKATVYLYVTGNGLASYEFSATSTSIDGVEGNNSPIVSSRYFDLTGREVARAAQGVFIVKHLHENGTTSVEKIFAN